MNKISNFNKFTINESKSIKSKIVNLNGFSYEISKITLDKSIDMKSFDQDGFSKKYFEKSYYIISQDKKDTRIRTFSRLYEVDRRGYSKDTFDNNCDTDDTTVVLDHGDESYLDEMYEIISHNNKKCMIRYDYLMDSKSTDEDGLIYHPDLISKYKSNL